MENKRKNKIKMERKKRERQGEVLFKGRTRINAYILNY
jgi:hypothetical protein